MKCILYLREQGLALGVGAAPEVGDGALAGGCRLGEGPARAGALKEGAVVRGAGGGVGLRRGGVRGGVPLGAAPGG